MTEALIEAQNISCHFGGSSRGWFNARRRPVRAVSGISFVIRSGETLGLAGESGCGKSTTANLVLRLHAPSGGVLRFRGRDVTALSGAQLKAYRKSVQAVFQDPFSSLNPRMRVGRIVAEPLVASRSVRSVLLAERIAALLAMVGLPAESARLYPHQFSGGQRQRIAIARVLATEPDLIVLDEPVSALDVSVRAQILNLLCELQRKGNAAYFLIAHDLAVMRQMCDRIAVMYLGEIVETAPSTALYTTPAHPYTRMLLSSILPSRPGQFDPRRIATGEPPSPLDRPHGCAFRTRCPHAMPICGRDKPIMRALGPDHHVACHME